MTQLNQQPNDERFVSEVAEAKPDTKFRPVFAARLRETIENKLKNFNNKTNFLNIFYMKKLTIGVGAVALVAVVALVAYPNLQSQLNPQNAQQQILAGKFAINSVSERAFGDINAETINQRPQGGGGGMGMGGDAYNMASSQNLTSSVAPSEGTTEPSVNQDMSGKLSIMPPYYTYGFSYKGEDISGLLNEEQSVFRRVNVFNTQSSASSLLKQYSLGLVDFTKFQQPKLQNFTIVEDRQYGYIINVDLVQGSVNIYQNWEKWPHPEANCRDENCYMQYRTQLSQIPNDETLIDIANAFAKAYSISLTGYGQPFVQNDWRLDYERAADKSTYYIPDSLNVVFPLQLEGKTVLDQGGNPTGLMMSIEAKSQKVTSIYGLTNKQFDKSNYQGVTDSSRILKLAENGGWQNYMPLSAEVPGGTKATIELGTPTVELVQIWKYDSGMGQELFVPSLVFPITNQPQSDVIYYWPRKVIVPLVKELLDENQGGGPIRIMEGSVPAVEVQK